MKGGRRMKKVLVIFGSPRKGNTWDVLQKTEAAMKQLGSLEFEHIFLNRADIKPCLGCFNCFTKGVEVCPFKDETISIREKMGEADGVIFATPVYAMTMSALLKQFMERNAFMCHRPEFFDKPAMFIATTGGVGIKETFKAMDTFQTWGFHSVTKLGLTAPPMKWRQGFIDKREAAIRKKAGEFFDLVHLEKIPDPGLNMVLFYYAFKKMVSITPKDLPKDNEHWKKEGWLDESSHYFRNDVRVGLMKRLAGDLMGYFIAKGAKKEFYI